MGEHKLLPGDGTELESVNMRMSYQIRDLHDYLLQSTRPEEELRAQAYAILLRDLVSTDLDTLLSRDRVSFSDTVKARL